MIAQQTAERNAATRVPVHPARSLGGVPVMPPGRWLDPADSQVPELTTPDKRPTAWADEQAADALRERELTGLAGDLADYCDQYQNELAALRAELQRRDDPAAEMDAIAAKVRAVCPGLVLTVTRTHSATYGDILGGASKGDRGPRWAVLATSPADGWVAYHDGESLNIVAAQVIDHWARR